MLQGKQDPPAHLVRLRDNDWLFILRVFLVVIAIR
jgi:hypothetical protein